MGARSGRRHLGEVAVALPVTSQPLSASYFFPVKNKHFGSLSGDVFFASATAQRPESVGVGESALLRGFGLCGKEMKIRRSRRWDFRVYCVTFGVQSCGGVVGL